MRYDKEPWMKLKDKLEWMIYSVKYDLTGNFVKHFIGTC